MGSTPRSGAAPFAAGGPRARLTIARPSTAGPDPRLNHWVTSAAVRPVGVVVLVGAAGSGKSTWAAEHYRGVEIVSSDTLRGLVGSGPADLDASADAFALLDQLLAARTRRGLTTAVDTLGLDPERRRGYLALARRHGLPATVVLLDTPDRLCRDRNAVRDRRVPATALTQQLRSVRALRSVLVDEGWDDVLVVTTPGERPIVESGSQPVDPVPLPLSQPDRDGPEVILQLSRFPWGTEPLCWLQAVARRAADVGFDGVALMDHLIQIPQVDRAWEPIPDPWVTLGSLTGLDRGLRLGTLVSPVTFREPGIIAKMAATLDVLSGGRSFLGLGAGWHAAEHRAYGLDFPPARQRLDRLQQTIETCRALWAPGTRPYQGQYVDLPETTCYPRPSGDLPILVGGSGERRTLRIVAEHADGCNLPSQEETLVAKLAVLRDHCARIDRDPATLWTTVLDLPVLGTDRDDVAARIERHRGRTKAAAFTARHVAGTAPEHAVRYRRLQRDHGVDTVFLALADLQTADDLDRCAPLFTALQ